MKKLFKNKKGFTLVELIVVIAILAILALILIPSITGYIAKADTARKEANARSLYTGAMLAVQTETEDAKVKAEAVKLANLPAGTTVTISYSGKSVTSVTVDGITFNGTAFSEAKGN